MQLARELGDVQTFVALDAASALESGRRGASVQLDDAYYGTTLSVTDDPDRTETLQRSRERWRNDRPEVAGGDEASLRRASDELQALVDDLPEVAFLADSFPGTCFGVPEWLRSGDQLQYGVRVYFFADDAPSPNEIVERNVEDAVADRQRAFEAYKGRLHGYPECCVEAFGDRRPDAPAPEWRSVAPLADRIDDEEFGPDASVDAVVPGFFEDGAGDAFFAREFFPEPGCDAAATLGREIREALGAATDETLARDYFRCNYLHDYVLTRSLLGGRAGRRPAPGALGREHRYQFLPLGETLSRSRYGGE
ncbi:hypothetical protein [Halomicrococcus gelatinilyticus]|uniref:hypothetical protein n=1 Tax=Halomicrococcus gelatinilyticus TaxID=1702103 RepID=UPI002E14A3CB